MEEIDKHINGEDLNPKFWKKIMEGLYKSFKFNPCCYDILKIKNALIININLTFSKKISSQKM